MTHTASGCGRGAVLTWPRDLSKSDITSYHIMIIDGSYHTNLPVCVYGEQGRF